MSDNQATAVVTELGPFTNPATGQVWSKDLGGIYTHEEAEALPAKANAEKLHGFDDWKLPTVAEQFSNIDHEHHHPACDPVFTDMQSDAYWTSTLDASDKASYAWAVGFGYGYVFIDDRYGRFRVRLVRSPRQ